MKTQFGDFVVLENGSLEEKEEAAIKLLKQMYKEMHEKDESPDDWKIEIVHKNPSQLNFISSYKHGTVALKWTRR